MAVRDLDSDLLNYLVESDVQPGEQLPSLQDLSAELQINIGKLREQLEVARALGLVEVRPRTGIRCKEYDFLPAIRLSLLYALARDRSQFDAFSEVRNHLEAAFWHEAIPKLTPADLQRLRQLCQTAWDKLAGNPHRIQIPHAEHRAFHLLTFTHLDNPFVKGILEAYWEAYEAVERNTYADLDYWRQAWTYHERILSLIDAKDFEAARIAFIEHTGLLRLSSTNGNRPKVSLETLTAETLYPSG
jgi:DNA-binding FadR family transcriptional regulator